MLALLTLIAFVVWLTYRHKGDVEKTRHWLAITGVLAGLWVVFMLIAWAMM